MRLLVTGPGRLGGPLIAELHRHGITGKVLQRSAPGALPPGWQSVRADVTRPESLAGVCTDCDHVLHLAAVTHSNRSRRYIEVNALGTRNLVAEARRAGVQRFTLVSTRAISPAGGAYSRSKIQAEEIVRDSGLAWNILRPAEVYGAGGEGISTLIERCRQGRWVPVVGDGSPRLAPIYLDDVIDGIRRAVMSPGHGGVHVLAGPEEMSYLELIRRLAAFFQTRPRTIRVPAGLLALAGRVLAILPLEKPPLYADQVARLFSPKSHDIESAFRAFGFTARPLEQGLNALFRPRSGSGMSFDEHSADYSEKVARALAVTGLEHGFFFEAKVRQILEATRRFEERRATHGAPRVLEIGCGIGLLTQRLRPLLGTVWGIDPSIASLGQAAARDGRMIAADGLRTPFADESFDMVIAVCVLHHVSPGERDTFLSEAARITRHGGLVLLCEHNPWNPLTRLVVSRCELDRDVDLLAQPEARRRLAAAGLSGIRSRYILFFPWRGAVWRWLEARLGWLPLGGQYVIDAVRR